MHITVKSILIEPNPKTTIIRVVDDTENGVYAEIQNPVTTDKLSVALRNLSEFITLKYGN